MKVIGITGGIGCGKSEVLNYLATLGAYIVEADKLAGSLMKKGETTYDRVVEEFGYDIIAGDGEIDRVKLGNIVFGNAQLLEKLNGIVHPAVKAFIINDINEKRNAGYTKHYIIEAALLIQDGYSNICDEIWYIYADTETRLQRLIKGRGGDASKYKMVMNNQADEDYYKNNSDRIIDNNGEFEKTQNVLKALLN